MTYSSEVLADSPLGYWRLGESSGTTMVDSSGNGRDGTHGTGATVGAASLLSSTSDTATSYSSGYSTVPHGAWMSSTDWSVECWFKPTTASGNRAVLSRYTPSGFDGVFHLRVDNGALNCYGLGIASLVTLSATGVTITAGETYHVVLTYTVGSFKIYVGGVLRNTISAELNSNSNPLTVAASNERVSYPEYFAGSVDEVAYYGSVLTAARITAHYDAGTAASSTTGTGASTAPPATSSGSGSVTISGSGASTSPPATSSGSGTVPTAITGTGSSTAPSATSSGAGTITGPTTGAGASTAPPATSSGAGTVDVGEITGTGSSTAPAATSGGGGSSGAEEQSTLFDTVTVEDLLYVELTADADLDVAVPILSEKHPSPVLTEANPVHQAYVDYTPTTTEVGFAHVWIDDVDVTYFRGKPLRVTNWTKEAPWGDKTAMFEMPQIEPWEKPGQGEVAFLRKDARVVIGVVDSGGNVDRKWSGFLHAHRRGFDSGETFTFEAHGPMWAAMFQAIEPAPYQPPIDVGRLIPRLLNRVISAPYKPIPEIETGILTRYRGARDEKIWQSVQNILAEAWTDDGRQWTLKQVADDEFRLTLKAALSTVHAEFAWGNPAIDCDLVIDEDSRVDGVYCRAISPGGGGWANVFYPGLQLLVPPPYPNSDPDQYLNLGTTDADTDSGTGVTDWQEKAHALGFGKKLRVTGVQSQAWVDVVEDVQRAVDIEDDGSIGPQTWNATFGQGAEDVDLTPLRLPMAVKNWVMPDLYDAAGLVTGPNPNYDPSQIAHFVYLDLGPGVTKPAGRLAARTYLSVHGTAKAVGTLSFRGCPDDLSRTDLDVGHNVKVKGFEGEDVTVQIGRISVDLDAGESAYVVSADVDAGARDALTIDQILQRNRDALADPARRPGNPNRSSRNVRDEGFSWDDESPCGVLRRTAVNGTNGLWSAVVIPFAEVGQLAGVVLEMDHPVAIAVVASLRLTENKMRNLVGNPFASSDPWRPHMDTLVDEYGLIACWGADGDGMGYYPGTEGDGYAFTGNFIEGNTIEYVTETPPYVKVFIYMQGDSGFVKGEFEPAYQT